MTLHDNIKLVFKYLTKANTLAYLTGAEVTKEKSYDDTDKDFLYI